MTDTEVPVEAVAQPSCVPWVADMGCCAGWDDYDPALQARALDLAWSTLKVLSGGQVGSCPVDVRPCLQPACDACAGFWMTPFIWQGKWFNCARVPNCTCDTLCEIVLPGPVAMVNAVNLGGTDLPLTDFRVDNGNRLVRQDGECWPSCQNMTADSGEPGTLTISYVPGVVPSPAGLWAAGLLACEYAKSCLGGKCRLPATVTTIVRQGVAMEMSSGMFANGTGIREVDAYLLTVNPNQLRLPSRVWSPDLPAAKHRFPTWVGA